MCSAQHLHPNYVRAFDEIQQRGWLVRLSDSLQNSALTVSALSNVGST